MKKLYEQLLMLTSHRGDQQPAMEVCVSNGHMK